MRKQWLALACGAAVMPALVHAQEAEQESAQERAWDIEVEVSYLLKRGNSESESIIGKTNAAHEGLDWRQTAKAEAVNTVGENDNSEEERTAERYYASYKLDRKLADNNYLFNVLTYDKDAFSGFHYQASYALGFGRRFLETPTQTLDLEAGPGYRVECLEPEESYSGCDDKDESVIARFAGNYKWTISDNASVRQTVSTEVGEDNTSIRSETSLTSQINDHFAMRLTHLVTRDSDVPADTHNTDQETTVSLVYTF